MLADARACVALIGMHPLVFGFMIFWFAGVTVGLMVTGFSLPARQGAFDHARRRRCFGGSRRFAARGDRGFLIEFVRTKRS
jgi:hypothetical protein